MTEHALKRIAGKAKASPADVRRNNRSLIFNLLFPSSQYSRADLGRLTGLSRVAVSDVVNDMLDEGIIRENGYETGTGKGKRGTLLSIDTTRLHIISLDLSQQYLLQGAMTDLLGTPRQRMEVALDPESEIGIDVIVQLVDQLRTDIDATDATVIGIGVSCPGVVENGVVRVSTQLGWRDVDLKSVIESRFGIPVTVSNDVTSSMLTERYFGQAGPDLLFVKVDQGVGAALLIDDAPVHGVGNAGGEIGHISIDPDSGPQCPCGKRGCMEMLISAPALRTRMADEDREGRRDILRKAGTYLASALAMPVGLTDMADICVYGPPDIVNNTLLEAAQERLNRATASQFHAVTTIRRCQCGADVTLHGAAIAVLREYFSLQ
ncbi:ROK family transcriptional regulator [Bifidobacterium samirii]|uniref:NagC family transcriptional regulator n=1 Tax=Bifidobacterium samirii TaxID=2306974 RepID=A0A430FUW0_9BIFI|nr:ROK family transcriptional regulator [Bifidobacterium samirii]RSX57254.1 NagC family transcriptional regulator [Bifidobacterium samirii]